MQDDLAEQASCRTVLAAQEVSRRKVVLTRLQDALSAHDIESVLVGRHALTLRTAGPWQPSGPADPELHVLGVGHRHIVTTDGQHYHFAGADPYPADDPGGAAGRLVSAESPGRK